MVHTFFVGLGMSCFVRVKCDGLSVCGGGKEGVLCVFVERETVGE